MKIKYSHNLSVKAAYSNSAAVLPNISETYLRELVEVIAFPRHYFAQPKNNHRAARWIAEKFKAFGYEVSFQGEWSNVVALSNQALQKPCIVIGAHYDSVPTTPGADDNASGVAAMLVCAEVIAKFAPNLAVCFVAFNREEDGLVGSTDFVDNFLPQSNLQISHAHILEMLGYCSHAAGTQKKPFDLPLRIPGSGNFLGLLSNHNSNALLDHVMQCGRNISADFPVIGLKTYFGIENRLPVLERSDHAAFWKAGIPAVMWTDTAEFRNPNYHQPTDTPDTLDYSFLRKVTQVLLASLLNKQ
jgi:Zn-dependent M28 family amino/carboxypeptidase